MSPVDSGVFSSNLWFEEAEMTRVPEFNDTGNQFLRCPRAAPVDRRAQLPAFPRFRPVA
jgi:hypothetical protein